MLVSVGSVSVATDEQVMVVEEVFTAGVEHESAHVPPAGHVSMEDLYLTLQVNKAEAHRHIPV